MSADLPTQIAARISADLRLPADPANVQRIADIVAIVTTEHIAGLLGPFSGSVGLRLAAQALAAVAAENEQLRADILHQSRVIEAYCQQALEDGHD